MRHRSGPAHDGFSLIEAMVALFVLSIGLLSLAAVLTKAVTLGTAAAGDLQAKEKAFETIENIMAARDAQILRWDDLRNVSAGGRFVDGERQILQPGVDGIVGTADDRNIEFVVEPGPNGALGDGDDVNRPLTQFTRRIEISQMPNEPATLRQIVITIRYRYGDQFREYKLVSLITSYS